MEKLVAVEVDKPWKTLRLWLAKILSGAGLPLNSKATVLTFAKIFSYKLIYICQGQKTKQRHKSSAKTFSKIMALFFLHESQQMFLKCKFIATVICRFKPLVCLHYFTCQLGNVVCIWKHSLKKKHNSCDQCTSNKDFGSFLHLPQKRHYASLYLHNLWYLSNIHKLQINEMYDGPERLH